MKIRVLFFASLAEKLGVQQRDLQLDEQAAVGDALRVLASDFPQLDAMKSGVATAVNMRYVSAEHRLEDGDELALIPPVSGG